MVDLDESVLERFSWINRYLDFVEVENKFVARYVDVHPKSELDCFIVFDSRSEFYYVTNTINGIILEKGNKALVILGLI